jgi:hypothetical protein
VIGTAFLRRLTIAAPFLLAAPLVAQAPGDTGGTRVRAIEIERHNVFDSTQTRYFYARLMNALHVVTHEGVVRNEVLLRPGQPYDSALAAETERNLRRLSIFQTVTLDTVRTDSGLVVRVVTQDGWSTKPAATFKSTGGELAWSVALVEDNLAGTNTHLFSRYAVDPDRTTAQVAVRKDRFIAHRLGVLLNYQSLSDGRIGIGQFGLPYLSLSARAQALLSVQSGDVRILEYFDGNTAAATDTIGRRYTLLRGDFGWAPSADPEGYVRLGVATLARRDDFRPYNAGTPFADDWYGAFIGSAEWRRAHYAVIHGFTSLSRDEDVDLSTTVSGGVALAPGGLGYGSTGVGPVLGLHTGYSLGHGFGFLDAHANALYSSSGLDSGTATLAGTLVLAPRAGHLLVLHADAGWKDHPAPGDNFDLGLGVGPRAFPLHAFTGDREAFFTAEYRVAAAHDVFGLFDFGVAASVDHGGAWYAGSPSRWGDDVGIGIRLGSVRATRPDATRFDLSWRFANDAMKGGWVFSVARGFAFLLPVVS